VVGPLNVMKLRFSLLRKLFLLALCAGPAVGVAQVAFVIDSMQSTLCLAQNWDTPSVQSWLSRMPKSRRMQVFGSLPGSSASKRCLMELKPAPVALCERVIAQTLGRNGPPPLGGGAPYLNLTSEESDQIMDALATQGHACLEKEDAPDEDAPWLPKGLEVSAETKAVLAAAKAGDRSAQIRSYALYSEGKEIPASEERADHWLTMAANGGDANSQFILGQAFKVGRSPHSTNYANALAWLTKAAQQGLVAAQVQLAYLYESGPESYDESAKGIQRDPVAARKWWTEASHGGDGTASCHLGKAARDGRDVQQDTVQAEIWYRKAVDQKNTECMLELATLLSKTPSQNNLLESQQLLRRADSLGRNGTTLNLSGYLPWGLTAADDAERLSLQRDLAERGDPDAQLAIAKRYFYGDGVIKNPSVAVAWWRKAAAANDPIGQRMLGKALMYGWDHEDGRKHQPSAQDREAAKAWLHKAAAQDDAEAARTLATLSATQEEAQSWLEKARALGYPADR